MNIEEYNNIEDGTYFWGEDALGDTVVFKKDTRMASTTSEALFYAGNELPDSYRSVKLIKIISQP